MALANGDERRAEEVRTAAEALAEFFQPERPGPVWYALFLEGFDPDGERAQLECFAEETVLPYARQVIESLEGS